MNNNEIKFKINQNYYSDIDQINNRLFVGKNTAEIVKVYIDIQYMFTNKKKRKNLRILMNYLVLIQKV